MLVVSPLISLMADQVQSLELKGIKTTCLRDDLSVESSVVDIEVRFFHFLILCKNNVTFDVRALLTGFENIGISEIIFL